MLNIKNVEMKKRLLVVVPEGLVDDTSLAEKVYKMALRDSCDVLYLALVEDVDTRMTVLRHMVTLSALTGTEQVTVKSILVQSEDWIDKLEEYLRPGDRIVCCANHMVKKGWLKPVSIHEKLEAEFNVPVILLSGIYHPWKTTSRKWLYAVLFWLGCLAILAGFGILEFQIDHGLQGIARTALIGIALLVEFGTFWAWSHVPKM